MGTLVIRLACFPVELLADIRRRNGLSPFIELDQFVPDIASDEDTELRAGITEANDLHPGLVRERGAYHRFALREVERVFGRLPRFAQHHDAAVAGFENLPDAFPMPLMERLETADEKSGFRSCICHAKRIRCPCSLVKMNEYRIARRILALLKGIRIHPAYLTLPLLLSGVAAAFEGMSVGLLIPLLNGFLQQDFSFIKEAPYIGSLIMRLPAPVLASDRTLFMVLLGIFVAAVVSKCVLRYCATAAMQFIALRSIHHLRKQLCARYLSFGKLYFDAGSLGGYSAVLTAFPKAALRPLLVIDKYVNAFFSILAYLVVLLLISWELTLFALPLFVVLHASVHRLIAAVERFSHRIAASMKALTARGIEILGNIALVKAYDMEDRERRRYAQISDEMTRVVFRSHVVQDLVAPLQELLTLFSMLLLFSGMLYLMVREDAASAPSFIAYFYVVLNAAQKFGTLTGLRGALADASGGIAEVEEVLADAGKFFVPDGKETFPGLREAIDLRHLTFAFPNGRTVLRDVTFRVPKGKMTAIVGPTGAGKTTIINLLMRFYDAPPGVLLLDGRDIRSFRMESLHAHMALVSQDTLLFNDTLRGNIAYGLTEVGGEELMRSIEQARLGNLVARLPEGIEAVIGDKGMTLSGGEKQRVSIARALLKGADILILDEATSSLDSSTERLIQEAIDEAVKGKTTIVIAHRLSTIRHADRIVVIDEGQVAEDGALDELLAAKGVFHRLWEEQKFS